MKKQTIIKQPVLSIGVLFLFVIGMSISACDSLNLDDTEGIGQVNFHISDATEASKRASNDPGSQGNRGGQPNNPVEGLEEVNIDVQELRVHYLESAIDTVSADSITIEPDEEGDGEWITLPVEEGEINLLDLIEADTLLASAELDEGFYSEIRLILGNENNIVVDGETHSLKVPSGQQSGFKIKLGEPLHSGEILDLTIEFDAEKSVKVTGNGQYMLQPVLNAFHGRTNGSE